MAEGPAAGSGEGLAPIGGGPSRIAAAAGDCPCHRARLGLGEFSAASLFGAMVPPAEWRVLSRMTHVRSDNLRTGAVCYTAPGRRPVEVAVRPGDVAVK